MITNLGTFLKDPIERLDYTVNWASWMNSGDSISVSSWSIAAVAESQSSLMNIPTGFNPTITTSIHKTTIWLQQGIAGVDYLVSNRITTANSRVAERSFTIQCRDQ